MLYMVTHKKSDAQQQSREISLEKEKDATSSSEKKSAGSQLYHGDNFEFEYPAEWTLHTEGISELALLRPGMSLPDQENLPATDGIYWGDIIIDVHSNPKNLTVEEYFKQSGEWSPFTEELGHESFVLHGNEIFKFNHVPGFLTSSVAYIRNHGFIVEITDVDDEYQDILDQVISTFNFISP